MRHRYTIRESINLFCDASNMKTAINEIHNIVRNHVNKVTEDLKQLAIEISVTDVRKAFELSEHIGYLIGTLKTHNKSRMRPNTIYNMGIDRMALELEVELTHLTLQASHIINIHTPSEFRERAKKINLEAKELEEYIDNMELRKPKCGNGTIR